MLDVRTASENAFQVHPSALHVDPHVEQVVDLVEAVLPGHGIILKHLEVRRQLHGCHRVDVLLDLGEEVVPATDDLALVLVVDQVQLVRMPSLAHLTRNEANNKT